MSSKGGVWKPRAIRDEFPELREFVDRWRERIGDRPVNLAGLPAETLTERARPDDWIIIKGPGPD